jgi:hypothetical protein
MDLALYCVNAVGVEGRSLREVAAATGRPKKWLRRQPEVATIRELQAQVDRFVHHFNEVRPHQVRGCPPLIAWRAPDKSAPQLAGQTLLASTKVRHDRIDRTGCVTLRYRSRLHHVGLGRAHAGQSVLILMPDFGARVIDVERGTLRHFELDPKVDYQKRGSRQGPGVRLSQNHWDITMVRAEGLEPTLRRTGT